MTKNSSDARRTTALSREAQKLLADGKKIEAIKLHREESPGLSLMEAKKAVEAYLNPGEAATNPRPQAVKFPLRMTSKEAKHLRKIAAEALRVPLKMKLDLEEGVSMQIQFIPAGAFIMGFEEALQFTVSVSPERQSPLEMRQHTVQITKPFYLAATVVTQAQWKHLIGTEPWNAMDTEEGKGDDFPAWMVDWFDACSFCETLCERTGRTASLPTEAQWEYACRAGSAGPYYFRHRGNTALGRVWKTGIIGKNRGLRHSFGRVRES